MIDILDAYLHYHDPALPTVGRAQERKLAPSFRQTSKRALAVLATHNPSRHGVAANIHDEVVLVPGVAIWHVFLVLDRVS
jgi:hypothetical protein